MTQNHKTMFLYAGQGSQTPGMGKDLYEANECFRKAIDAAADCLKEHAAALHLPDEFDLKSLLFTGNATASSGETTGQQIHETAYTQPAMVAFACAMTDLLKEKGYEADYAAGLSLGEYSALYAAGVLSLPEVVALARFRGVAMTNASAGVESAMSAVLGLAQNTLEEICAAVTREAAENAEQGKKAVVSVCNLNCPGQIVIGGEASLVAEAARRAQEAGARRCIPLKVSGPFHTAYMHKAGDALAEYFKTITFSPARIPVMFNYIGKEVMPEKMDAETIQDLLVQQVQNPVRMEEILRRCFALGIDHFVEIGPGKTLSGFVKKVAKDLGIEADAYRIESFESAADFQ